MSQTMIEPSNRPIITDGHVFYDDKTRTNNTIRLKRRIIEQFPDLREPNSIFYRAELYPNYGELGQRIEQVTAEKQGIPILLFLYKENG